MSATNEQLELDEFARRGDAVYEKRVRTKLIAGDVGKFVAVDVGTGGCQVPRSELRSGDWRRKRLPDARIGLVQIGHGVVRDFGGGLWRDPPRLTRQTGV